MLAYMISSAIGE